jgi:predicted nuclease of predicted toxin-antitoxin system
VVWLRIGNAPTAAVAALLREHFHVLQQFHADEEVAFLTFE